jgi:tRNA1(Val) A37 N6-methylase TrmN6
MNNYDNTVEDLYLNGLKIIQNNNLYKFTSDAILLSKFADAKTNDIVADFCAGSGIVGLHFFGLNPIIKSMTFFEMQKSLYDISKQSIEINNLKNFDAVNCKLQDISNEYNGKFSLILCNPPYERVKTGMDIENYNIAVCRHEIELKLKEIIEVASKKLKYGGRLAMVNRADRLSEVICEMKNKNIEPKKLQFVQSKDNKQPYLLMIEGVLGGRSGIKILNNIVNKNFGEI